MQDKQTQEKLKEIKRWLAIQRFTIGLSYTTALLMLLCAVSSAEAHDMSSAIIQGGLGTFNCYIGDQTRRRYTRINRLYKELLKEIDKFNNLKDFHEQLVKFLESIKRTQQNQK